jgi:hypothetical protein
MSFCITSFKINYISITSIFVLVKCNFIYILDIINKKFGVTMDLYLGYFVLITIMTILGFTVYKAYLDFKEKLYYNGIFKIIMVPLILYVVVKAV